MNLLTAQAPGGVPRSGKGLALGICRFMLVALALVLSYCSPRHYRRPVAPST
jgi:formate dehydrogenase subunit gamma